MWGYLGGLRREGAVLEIRRNAAELLGSVDGPLKIYKYKCEVNKYVEFDFSLKAAME